MLDVLDLLDAEDVDVGEEDEESSPVSLLAMLFLRPGFEDRGGELDFRRWSSVFWFTKTSSRR